MNHLVFVNVFYRNFTEINHLMFKHYNIFVQENTKDETR